LRRLQTLSSPAGAPVLGRLRHFAFQNLARDDHLPPDHWFWDSETSGGSSSSTGCTSSMPPPGCLAATPAGVRALEVARGQDGPVDTAIAAASHPGGATATYTHIFAHPGQAEYQQTMLDWGFAHAVVSGWIPVDLHLEAWTDPDGAALLRHLPDQAGELLEVPGFRRSGQERITVEDVRADGRPQLWRDGGQARVVSHQVRVRTTLGGNAAK
jgi:hypothetical protein